ncbi:AAA family ATPase [Moraxella oculi]|uniref:AAA family ATPase n=1 Tax=Moraxella oculi TaxID=2940516 RepID=A0ABW8U420_9GAMM
MRQTTALNILKTGKNVFLTGQAGAGKTHLLKQYIDYLRARDVSVAVTASTGIAATHMNGMTIHAWSGMGIKNTITQTGLRKLKSHERLYERIRGASVLIVDEISMLHAKQVELLNEILKFIREDQAAFGGIQVVFSGDFFQLPPVSMKDETKKERFAFMSQAWLDADFQTCYLSEQHRQSTNEERGVFGVSLNDILNQIREQNISNEAVNALRATEHNDIAMNRTRLYTHNANVDEVNQSELDRIQAKTQEFFASSFGEKNLAEMLKKSVRAPEKLTLKVGAKVMFVKNNPNLGVSNGTLGKVVDFVQVADDHGSPVYPKVLLNNGNMVIAEPDEWIMENGDGELLASYTQVPLCLAWAMTVHKSQGMTLDAAEIDLTRTFEMGQGYVALSRLKSLSGLKLLGFNQKSLLLDAWVFQVDKRFQELSAQQEKDISRLDANKLSDIHDKFILASGGKIQEESMLANEANINKMQAKHQHIEEALKTLQQQDGQAKLDQILQETKQLLEQGLTIKEIANKRFLAESTIIGHIDHLYQQDKTLNLKHIRPDDAVVAVVQKAYEVLYSQGEFVEGFRLRPIVEMLDGIGYNAVRLALIFIDKKDNQSV